jgi:hypothetical protein
MLSILRRQNIILEKELLEIRKEHEALMRKHKKCERVIADKEAQVEELIASRGSVQPILSGGEREDSSVIVSSPSQLLVAE